MVPKLRSLLILVLLVSLFSGANAQSKAPLIKNKLININSTNEKSQELAIANIASYIKVNDVKRVREINVNEALKTINALNVNDTILLDLFDGAKYKAFIDKINLNINGTLSIRARLLDYHYAYFIISTTKGKSFFTVNIPEKNQQFMLRHSSDKVYLVEVDPSKLDVLEGAPSPILPSHYKPLDDKKASLKDGVKNDPLDPVTIDMMILYTPAAEAWANSDEGGINNTISDLMEISQLALDNSNTNITLNLSYSGPVDYTESGDPNTDLYRFTFSEDFDPWYFEGGPPWYMDTIHDWRDEHYADLVVLLFSTELTGGIGWLLDDDVTGYPELGFSLTRVQQASWTTTTIHEMGHNMGCHHHKLQNFQAGPGIYDYSAGWRWTGNDNGKYCDVMTYTNGSYFDDGITHTRVLYFSDPNINYKDTATGDVADGDNARTLRETKHVVAAYREDPTVSIPSVVRVNNVTISPNPATDNLMIGGVADRTNASIYSIEGKLMQSEILNNKSYEINIAELPKGIYILKLYNEEKTYVTRFVKQ